VPVEERGAVLLHRVPRHEGHLPALRVALLHCRRGDGRGGARARRESRGGKRESTRKGAHVNAASAKTPLAWLPALTLATPSSSGSPSPLPLSPPQNELGVLEFIHAFVETLDKYFENVCELDIMFNLEKAHFILEEMVTNGCIVETNKANILKPILLLEKVAGK
jgi:hypothetical protein